MTNQGVKFHLPPGGQFSAAVDNCCGRRAGRRSLFPLAAFVLPRLDSRGSARRARVIATSANRSDVSTSSAFRIRRGSTFECHTWNTFACGITRHYQFV
jgi:hypothetical protein